MPFSNVIDLRGKTSILEVLSIIKNKCSYLILPDGGILSLTYFLDINFPIKIVSLWNDYQGVLKQRVRSPNQMLEHIPIVTTKSLMKVPAERVIQLLFEDKKKGKSINLKKIAEKFKLKIK